jgi:hypothetical protein
MQKDYVRYFSPGTFVSETTEKLIDVWDVDKAIEMAHDVVERYHAVPYAFQFVTYSRGDEDLDSHQSAKSCMYFLGGKIETLAEIEARNDPKEEILRSNMRSGGYDKIVVNDNSWRSTMPFGENDIMLDVKLGPNGKGWVK